MSVDEYMQARERGRRKAVAVLMVDLEKRQELEATYGVEYCKRRYPEVYRLNVPPRFE